MLYWALNTFHFICEDGVWLGQECSWVLYLLEESRAGSGVGDSENGALRDSALSQWLLVET